MVSHDIFLLFLVSGVVGILTISLSITSDTIGRVYSQEAQVITTSRPHNVTEPGDTVLRAAPINNLTHTEIITESTNTTLGTELEHQNDWTTANNDIFGSRDSNQTIIGKDNVNLLHIKWILPAEFVIEDAPVIVGHTGFVQDNGGNVIAFGTKTGLVLWKLHLGTGGNMHGLTYDHGILYSGTGHNATTVAMNSTNGAIIWQSSVLGPSKEGYSVATPPIVWKDYMIVGSAGGDFPPEKGVVQGNITALNRTNGKIIWNFRTTTGD